MPDEGLTQKDIGKKINWDVSKVKDYSTLLNNIKVEEVLKIAKEHQEGHSTKKVEYATFDFTRG